MFGFGHLHCNFIGPEPETCEPESVDTGQPQVGFYCNVDIPHVTDPKIWKLSIDTLAPGTL